MAITPYTEPLFTLTCDRCDYTADADESETTFFDSEKRAREWARDNGWNTSPRKDSESVICPGCNEEDEAEAEQNAEIAAAMQYALDNA